MTKERGPDQAYASRLVILLGIVTFLLGFLLLLIPAIVQAAKCWYSGSPLPGGLVACWKEGWAYGAPGANLRLVLGAPILWVVGICLVIVGITRRPRRR